MPARCVHQVGVSVSLNGQQFDLAVEGTHGYRAPPVPTRLTPRAGPASASTRVLVEAHNLGWGVDYRCALDGVLVPALYNLSVTAAPPAPDPREASPPSATAHNKPDGTGTVRILMVAGVEVTPTPLRRGHVAATLRCVVPPRTALTSGDGGGGGGGSLGGGGTAAVAVRLSLNGGADLGLELPFEQYNATATSVEPAGGPEGGGTRVVVSGAGLDAGHDRQCSFGGSRVPASVDANGTSLVCVSPPGVAGAVPLEFSLNGQDLGLGAAGACEGDLCDAAASALVFTYYAPPTIAAISPPTGPSRGGTAVTLSGALTPTLTLTLTLTLHPHPHPHPSRSPPPLPSPSPSHNPPNPSPKPNAKPNPNLKPKPKPNPNLKPSQVTISGSGFTTPTGARTSRELVRCRFGEGVVAAEDAVYTGDGDLVCYTPDAVAAQAGPRARPLTPTLNPQPSAPPPSPTPTAQPEPQP